MELWELVARESIRDRIARWNANGDAGRMAEMVKVLAPEVEFSIREGEVVITNLEELTRRAYPLLDAYERRTPEYVGMQGQRSE